MIDSLVNRGEFFSAHYLDALLDKDLTNLIKGWDEREGRGEDTPRTLLRAARGDYFRSRGAAAEEWGTRSPNGAVATIADIVLRGLGFTPARETLELERSGGETVAVPIVARIEGPTGPVAVALEAGFAAGVDELLDTDPDAGAGILREPVTITPGNQAIADVSKAISCVFQCEDPPRFVVLVGGGAVLLADRAKWGEGRYLAVDLDTAFSRNDTKRRGELETIAALFSADALVPRVEGTALIDHLAEKSRSHAVGVSADLREGLRESVEILANEVIAQRVAAKYSRLPDGDARELTKQCLRYLYRLVVLLYAESRPELGILPTGDRVYEAGYGLERLRQLTLADLTGESAQTGRHIQDSLARLFTMVNDGHNVRDVAQQMVPDDELAQGDMLVVRPLASALFDAGSTRLIDRITLRNEPLQRVLRLLMLSREKRGRERGFISYAQLGINQLGAVYEGLMAYSGLFADRDYYEVARKGDPKDGIWLVPVTEADDYPDEVFVTRTDPLTDETRRVRHAEGSFVYRLSGRDRQRSASYYTPEILTQCVVEHSLAELLDQDGDATPASRILELTICEPALGSGAFLNEAINQLAAEYLRRRQDERGEAIEPDKYEEALQRVKAHIAMFQCYGVDLNDTAVELAEVSLWLNAMHPGLQAPWFGLHLRRGNSLIGARRATYRPAQLAKRAYLKAPPEDRPLAAGPIGVGEIHHFLLPAHGWAAGADAKQAKELRPEAAEALREWRKRIQAAPTKGGGVRLQALAARVEEHWQQAAARLGHAERALRRDLGVYGDEREVGRGSTRTARELLDDPDASLARLRLAMDAWTALWFWPIADDSAPDPPEWGEWLNTLEELLGTGGEVGPGGQMDLLGDLDYLIEREKQLTLAAAMRPVDEVVRAHPWLGRAREVARAEGAWHWELEFAHVFAHGGFDLQLGNPPWVRPRWLDDLVLAELDPWFGVTEKPPVRQFRERRERALESEASQERYLAEIATGEGAVDFLGSSVMRPVLAGVQTNLYMVFMDQTWRNAGEVGVVGLLHPEGHFTDPKAGALRSPTYRRLRRHFQFRNELKLFSETHNAERGSFSVSIYASQRDPRFINVAHLFSPATIAGSLAGREESFVPGVQYPGGGWDLRPHASRVITVDREVLASWARLFDEPGTPADEARLLRPVTVEDLDALRVLADQPVRLGDHPYHWTRGIEEDRGKQEGLIESDTRVPRSWDDVVLQGPHFNVGTPLHSQPNEACRHQTDYTDWDLETLSEDVIPRTNYQRACPRDEYLAAIEDWDGRPNTSYWRIVWRRMTQPGSERSLRAALLRPGPSHVHAVHSGVAETLEITVYWVGLWSSLPFDYLLKASGKSDVQDEMIRQFPMPHGGLWLQPILLRAMRMNCLTKAHAEPWKALFRATWASDSWTRAAHPVGTLAVASGVWTRDSPIRSEYQRRLALVELDALGALVLGLTADQLCAMYRSQFSVLRKYEHDMYFDGNGRQYARDHHAYGHRQQPEDWKRVAAEYERPGSQDLPDRIARPIYRVDRESEMRQAYAEFSRRRDAGELG